MSPMASLLILIVLVALFGTGAYYANRPYGMIGTIIVVGVGFTFIYGLYALGGMTFIK
ncbi:MAG TPA: hypothetical protein VLZ74_14675 [Methylocella sp.]|nr:hypothetical protein [Methylocella sp.]